MVDQFQHFSFFKKIVLPHYKPRWTVTTFRRGRKSHCRHRESDHFSNRPHSPRKDILILRLSTHTHTPALNNKKSIRKSKSLSFNRIMGRKKLGLAMFCCKKIDTGARQRQCFTVSMACKELVKRWLSSRQIEDIFSGNFLSLFCFESIVVLTHIHTHNIHWSSLGIDVNGLACVRIHWPPV